MSNSKVLDYDVVYGQDFGGLHPKEPHVWIQWKGTDVCAETVCACGHSGHVDAQFFYYYRCPACSAVYAVGQNIKLIPLSEEQVREVERTREASVQSDTIV